MAREQADFLWLNGYMMIRDGVLITPPVTADIRQVQTLYFDVVSGRVPWYKHWLTPVHNRVPAGV
jgi:hypothetical protein